MVKQLLVLALVLSLAHFARAGDGASHVITGKASPGVMITAFDAKEDKSITAFSKADGNFKLPPLPARDYTVRARLNGFVDQSVEVSAADLDKPLAFTLEAATGSDLQAQRTCVDRLPLLKFQSEADRLNFRMTCTYCHQIGTEGFRAPQELVDWEVMVREVMAGPHGQSAYRNLSQTNKDNIPRMFYETFGAGAEERWPAYVPPAPPSGEDLDAVITEWPLGVEDMAMMHDLELGDGPLVYTIDSQNDCLIELNGETGHREVYAIPGGKVPFTEEMPIKAPHSIERAPNGDQWITLCYGREMARFTPATKEWLIIPSGAGGKKGGYPHTLRFDQKGICWYTDAASNAVYRLDPATLEIRQIRLLAPNQAIGADPNERSAALVPYGMSIAPDGKVWFTKLNGHRLGVIDPDTLKVTEWKPPLHGPRRHEVAADGTVWVPGFGSGDFAKFNPTSGEWKVYPLPGNGNEIPYALSVHPQSQQVWICGTGSDSIMRFDPKTEKIAATYHMPSHVTYTREIEFDKNGVAWVCNSNLPARHIEGHKGSLIKIEIPK